MQCPSFMQRWRSWVSASLTGSWGPKLVRSSFVNSWKLSIHNGWNRGFCSKSRSGSNQSSTMPLRYDCTKMTLVRSLWDAGGAVLVVQFALDQENAKFAGVGPIKLFRFTDSCLEGRGRRLLGTTGRMGQASDSLGQLSHDPTGYGLVCF